MDTTADNLRAAVESLQIELRSTDDAIRSTDMDLRRIQAAMQSLRSRRTEIAKAIETVESLIGVKKAPEGQTEPETTPEFVVAAIQKSGGAMKDAQIVEVMQRDLGWATKSKDPLATLRTVLSRMIDRGDVVRVAPATYDLPGSFHTVSGENDDDYAKALTAADTAEESL